MAALIYVPEFAASLDKATLDALSSELRHELALKLGLITDKTSSKDHPLKKLQQFSQGVKLEAFTTDHLRFLCTKGGVDFDETAKKVTLVQALSNSIDGVCSVETALLLQWMDDHFEELDITRNAAIADATGTGMAPPQELTPVERDDHESIELITDYGHQKTNITDEPERPTVIEETFPINPSNFLSTEPFTTSFQPERGASTREPVDRDNKGPNKSHEPVYVESTPKWQHIPSIQPQEDNQSTQLMDQQSKKPFIFGFPFRLGPIPKSAEADSLEPIRMSATEKTPNVQDAALSSQPTVSVPESCALIDTEQVNASLGPLQNQKIPRDSQAVPISEMSQLVISKELVSDSVKPADFAMQQNNIHNPTLTSSPPILRNAALQASAIPGSFPINLHPAALPPARGCSSSDSAHFTHPQSLDITNNHHSSPRGRVHCQPFCENEHAWIPDTSTAQEAGVQEAIAEQPARLPFYSPNAQLQSPNTTISFPRPFMHRSTAHKLPESVAKPVVTPQLLSNHKDSSRYHLSNSNINIKDSENIHQQQETPSKQNSAPRASSKKPVQLNSTTAQTTKVHKRIISKTQSRTDTRQESTDDFIAIQDIIDWRAIKTETRTLFRRDATAKAHAKTSSGTNIDEHGEYQKKRTAAKTKLHLQAFEICVREFDKARWVLERTKRRDVETKSRN